MAEEQGEFEQQYSPPTHLDESDKIGFLPARSFYVFMGAAITGFLPALAGYRLAGVPGAIGGFLPWLLLGFPFMLPLNPPVEHGLGKWLWHRFRRKTLHPQHHPSLRDVRIQGKVIYVGKGEECRAILALPTVNLSLASVRGIRRHRRLIGMLFDGISTHQFQVLIRAEATAQIASIERMRLNRNPFARKLAAWLGEHHQEQQAIDRRRYLIVPAPDVDTLEERVTLITGSFRQAGLEPSRVEEEADLRDLLNGWWTWRPHTERLGPELVQIGSKHVQADGAFMRVYAMRKLPTAIATNWWQRLVDGTLAADVSITYDQQNLWVAKTRLTMRYNQLASSGSGPGTMVALKQVAQLRMDFEGRVRPWNVQVLAVVRGSDLAQLERNAKRFEQQARDMLVEFKLLRWEQYEGLVSAQPLCLPMVPRRAMYLETGTLARTTPFAASTLQMADGVPFGEAGATVALMTAKNARTGKHHGWYGFTGSGKGFAVRMYLARRHFADRLRIFVWDADEAQHEYSGRWCQFLGGTTLVPHSLDDVLALEFDPRWQVVALDVTELPDGVRSRAFAIWKQKVQAHVLEFPGETAFVVDEATTLAYDSDQAGANALGDAVQRWRKMGIECHVITQRVSDWFNTAIGRKIQGNLAIKVYGAQEDSELEDVAKKVAWSSEERERIGGAGTGQFLVVAFGRRVWVDLFDQAAPFEFDSYNTDPPDRVEILPMRREAVV